MCDLCTEKFNFCIVYSVQKPYYYLLCLLYLDNVYKVQVS
jgi:hypothetical protein